MKYLGLTLRHDSIGAHHEWRDNLDIRWYSFLKALNITPLLLPNDWDLCQNLLKKFPLEGFILTGGADHPTRCTFENHLISYALQQNLPLLGVCHGMQMIQRYFGAALSKVQGHVCKEQTILWKGTPRKVNSYHELGTIELLDDFELLAFFPKDKVIKAIQHKSFKLLGMMWHPERSNSFDEEDINLFKTFFV